MTDKSRNASWDEARKAAVRFRLVPFDKIALDPSPAYLVRGLIPREGLAVAWGPPKCGKSFWAFDLAMHIARGLEYRGRRVRQGSVVYVACEGERGFLARADAYRQKFLGEEESVANFFLLPTRLDLVADRQQLIEDIRTQLDGVAPVIIVIDTLNRSFAGSESSDQDMGNYVKAADMIREAFKCAVLIIHHCGIDDKRPRGHTSLTGATDAQIAVRRDVSGLIVVKVEWLKDGAEGEQIHSRLQVVVVGKDEDGEEITSCVIVAADGEQSTQKRARLSPKLQQALDILRNCLVDAGEPSPGGSNYPTGGRVLQIDLWRDALLQSGVVDREAANPRQDFRRLLSGLQDRGVARMWGTYVWPSE